jgi:hypothetical protein
VTGLDLAADRPSPGGGASRSSAADSDQPEGRTLARSTGHIYAAEPGTSAVMNADMAGDAGATSRTTISSPTSP